MQIAVDARFLQQDEVGFGEFTIEVFSRLAETHSQHQFIFLVDKNAVLPKSSSNVSYLKITPSPTNAVLLKWWYDVKVPLALKKCKADVFVCPNGLCSLTINIAQVLMVPMRSFQKHLTINKNFSEYFFNKYIKAFLKKVKAIGVVSAYLQNKITNNYHISADKITVTGIGASNFFKAVSWDEKERIKEQYAHECEYFIFNTISHSAENLLNILKAFSIFKKWQKTNMKLLLVGAVHKLFEKERQKLTTYKYKNDVLLTGNFQMQELAKVTAGAYAAIFLDNNFPVAVLEAMQSEVPVIIAKNETSAEIAGDAALLINSTEPQEIAEQMKLVFKDEQLRSNLIEKGKLRAQDFSPNKTVDIVWQMIEKAVLA